MKIAFYGRVCEPEGYGSASRAYVHALHSTGIELSVINIGPTRIRSDSLIDSLLNRPMSPDLSLVNDVPLNIPPFMNRGRLINLTVWETDAIPEQWQSRLDKMLEVWVPCAHNVEVFTRSLNRTVFRWPCAIEPDQAAVDPDYSRLPQMNGSAFLFYSTFVWQDRKHPLGLVEAFFRAFPEDHGAVLLLKVRRWPRDNSNYHAAISDVRQKVGSTARLEIVDELWTQSQMEALSRRGDCYISLHRGEGWCYPLFDAACRGKPVIATAYSGPMDYLNQNDHQLVRYQMIPVMQQFRYYNSNMRWANPDLCHAAELIRYVFENQKSAIGCAQRAARRLSLDYSAQSVGQIAIERLARLLQ